MEENGTKQTPRVNIIAILATLGLLSAAFGFGAEATKPQLGEVKGVVRDEICTYPSSITPMGLGVAAIIALLVSRLYCPGAQSSSSVAQLSRFLSWIAWLSGIGFYVAGLIMINNQGEEEHEVYTHGAVLVGQYRYTYERYYTCQVVKPGIFGAGASFALSTIILEIIYLAVTFYEYREHKTTTDHTQDWESCKAKSNRSRNVFEELASRREIEEESD